MRIFLGTILMLGNAIIVVVAWRQGNEVLLCIGTFGAIASVGAVGYTLARWRSASRHRDLYGGQR